MNHNSRCNMTFDLNLELGIIASVYFSTLYIDTIAYFNIEDNTIMNL